MKHSFTVILMSLVLVSACTPTKETELTWRAPDSVNDDVMEEAPGKVNNGNTGNAGNNGNTGNAGNSGTKPPAKEPEPQIDMSNKSFSSEIQMADRSYVESVLLQIFNAANTTAGTYIQSDIYQKVEFGGACDPYSVSDIGATTLEFSREQCFTGIGVVQNSNNNPMRYSLTTKVCEKLVNDSTRMDVVRDKIYTTKKWARPDAASIQKAWKLFFPIEDADARVVTELLNVAKVSSTDEEGWKNIMLTLCISPEWQVL